MTTQVVHSVPGIFEANDCEKDIAYWKELIKDYTSFGQLILERIEKEFPDKVIWIQAETGVEIRGEEVARRVRNIACGLLDTYDVKPQSIFMISDENTIEQCLFAFGVICAGAIPCYVDHPEALVEFALQAREIEPSYFACRRENLHQVEFVESQLGYKMQAKILMDPSLSKDDESTFNYLFHHDHLKARSNSLVPVACRDIYIDVARFCRTSGTTGVAKNISISHARLLMDGVAKSGKLETSFIMPSVMQRLSAQMIATIPILTGCCRTIILNGMDIPKYLDALSKYKVGAIYLGATIFCELMEEVRLNKDKYDLSSVRVLCSFGAGINFKKKLELFCKENPQIKLQRLVYASSETSKIAQRDAPPVEALEDALNCGKLCSGVKVKIVDADEYEASGKQKLLGYDQVGLIFVKTALIFSGYWDKCQARLTNNIAPCPAPFPPTLSPYRQSKGVLNSEGYFITQDLGIMKSATNELCVVGRQKEVIQTQGFYRIMPYVLEQVFYQHPAVHLAVVFGVYNETKTFEYFRAIIMVNKEVAQLTSRSELGPFLLSDDKNCNIEDGFMFKGSNKLSQLNDTIRRDLLVNIHRYLASQVHGKKQCLAGVAIIDEIPTMPDTGKPNKRYLKSLREDEVEFYRKDVNLSQ